MPSGSFRDVTVSKITYMVERTSTVGWQISGNPQVGQWVVVACAEGAADYVIDATSYSVCKGDILLLNHAMQRRAVSDPRNPWHFFSVGFDLDFSSDCDRRALAGLPCVVRAPQLLPLFQELSGMWEMK